jgi:hypothetical protein
MTTLIEQLRSYAFLSQASHIRFRQTAIGNAANLKDDLEAGLGNLANAFDGFIETAF